MPAIPRSAALPLILLLGLGLLLAGCGFQLRGRVTLPEDLNRVYVQADSSSQLARLLRTALLRASVEVVHNAERANAVLTLHSEESERRVLAVGDTARARQFESLYRVNYSLRRASGEELIPMQSLQLSREFTFDETQLLAKEREETILQREMQREAMQRILQRLRYYANPDLLP